MKVNEEKLLQAAVDYAAALLCENGARVLNASPRGLKFETEVWPWIGSGPWTWEWEVQIEKDKKAQKVIPARNDAVVIATEQALRDAVQTGKVDIGWIDRPYVLIAGSDLKEWLFKVTRDEANTRFKVYGIGSDHSAISVVVNWRMHEPVMARAVAVELIEMLDAYVDGSVWMVSLYGRRTTSEKWHPYGQRSPLYGVSRVLLGIIELLTRQNLLSPGNGLRAISKTGMVYQEERT